jgi:hypothetical protein
MYVPTRRRGPIAFGTRRPGWDGPVRGAAAGLGSYSIPSSATPNPPGLTSGPSPLLVQPPWTSNPLQFASPQSAIAAGLDPTTVNTAWANLVNSYPSSQAAVNGGVAPGTVTELWNGGAQPAPPSWWKKNSLLLIAGVGAAALAFAGKREAR